MKGSVVFIGALHQVRLIAAAALIALHSTNLAAAEFCKAPVESGWASASSESEARHRAVLWWQSRAGAIGPGYENWDRARKKSILCVPRGAGKRIKCKAVASPCLPDGVLPAPKPGDKYIDL
jgi:hypothetical protein